MRQRLSFLLVSMSIIFVIAVLSITSEQLQSHAENVQIIFDPIFGHNHNGTNSAKLAANSVNTTQLVVNSVTDSKIAGPISVAKGGTGLSSLGSANQVLRVNSGETALEYATPSSGSGQEGDIVHILSKTIGDYSQPSSATASSVVQTGGGSIYDQTAPSGDGVGLGGGSSPYNTRVGLKILDGHTLIGKTFFEVSFWLAKSGSPTGNGNAVVYDLSGSLKATSDNTKDWSTLVTWPSSEKVTFNFAAGVSLAAGDRIVIQGGTTSGGNEVNHVTSTSDTVSNTNVVNYINGGWNDVTRDSKVEIRHSSGYPASNAIDGNTAIRWQSNQENKPWLKLDLGSNKDLAQLAINLNRINTTATTLKIYSSTDTTFDPSEVIVYINVSDFTNNTYRYILPNYSEDRRYILIETQENNTSLAINEVKVRHTLTDWALKHFHAKRDVSTVSSFNDGN